MRREPVASPWRHGGMGAERVVVPAPTVDEPRSFDDFYRREWPGAVRLAHLLTGVDAVAEDLAQESFTRIEPRWQVIAKGVGLEGALRSFVDAAIANHRGDPELHRVLFEEVPRPPDVLAELHELEAAAGRRVRDATASG